TKYESLRSTLCELSQAKKETANKREIIFLPSHPQKKYYLYHIVRH
ncbi:hypothetical protein MNBD_GAMMA08-475, partial [hydrothermal vent metagenome]